MRTQKKLQLETRRRRRMRQKIKGTAARPRMSVRFTGKHIYVQFVDDATGVTVAAASTRKKGEAPPKLAANVESAKRIGVEAAGVAKAKGVNQVVFDRSGARYHGKVKALADSAREAGLKF